MRNFILYFSLSLVKESLGVLSCGGGKTIIVKANSSIIYAIITDPQTIKSFNSNTFYGAPSLSKTKVFNLNFGQSDHNPILIDTNMSSSRKGTMPFKFLDYWVTSEEYMSILANYRYPLNDPLKPWCSNSRNLLERRQI